MLSGDGRRSDCDGIIVLLFVGGEGEGFIPEFCGGKADFC